PFTEIDAIAIELFHPVIGFIGHVEIAIRTPGDAGRPVEMTRRGAGATPGTGNRRCARLRVGERNGDGKDEGDEQAHGRPRLNVPRCGATGSRRITGWENYRYAAFRLPQVSCWVATLGANIWTRLLPQSVT